MKRSKFVSEAMFVGFSQDMAEWLEEKMAKVGHTHEIEDIVGLEEELADIEGGE